MLEAEFESMQRQSGRAALVGLRWLVHGAVVDLFPTNRVPEFGKMDADLVCPAGLQPTRQERVSLEPFLDFYVSDRLFADARYFRAPSSAVSSIPNQKCRHALGRHVAWHRCQVTADNCMSVELA